MEFIFDAYIVSLNVSFKLGDVSVKLNRSVFIIFPGKTMFKKAVRISVDICPANQSKQEESSVHTISIVLESG